MRHIFLFIISLLICSLINGEAPFKINGKIDDANVDTVFFRHWICEKDSDAIDTVLVINGTFTIEGIISPGTFARLCVNDEEVPIFIDPVEMQLHLKKDSLEKFVLHGSQTQTDRENVESQTNPLEDLFYKNRKQLDSEQSEQKEALLILQRDSIVNLLDSIRINFITSHPDSYYSPNLFIDLLTKRKKNADELMNLYNELSENVKATCWGKRIYNYILQRKESTMSNVSSFKALDKDGNLIKISDFAGKYILVDFWASWCVPCINGFPHLKELYSKYKDKGLAVIAISTDFKEDEQKWLNAIDKNDISEWIQILACKNEGEYNICNLHGTLLSLIPHYIVIDKSGNVIKQWRGFNDEIAKEQNKLFESVFEKP